MDPGQRDRSALITNGWRQELRYGAARSHPGADVPDIRRRCVSLGNLAVPMLDVGVAKSFVGIQGGILQDFVIANMK